MRQVCVCYTDRLSDLLSFLSENELSVSMMFVNTRQIVDGEESMLMIKDKPRKLEQVLQPLIDLGLMECFGEKAQKPVYDDDEIVMYEDAIYIQNPREPWLDMSETELETVQRVTRYHIAQDEDGNEIESGANWFGGFTWPRT